MNHHCWYLFFAFLLCFSTSHCPAQVIHPYFYQYTTTDGLPSSETYYLLQDRQGYIWVATDNGIARFDGYTFEVLGREQGLEDEVVFRIKEDAQGRIWVSTYGGGVFYYESGRFHAYEHNALLRTMKQRLHLITIEDINFPHGILFGVRERGLFYITTTGEPHWLTDKHPNGIYIYDIDDTDEVVVYDSRNFDRTSGIIIRYNTNTGQWDKVGIASEKVRTLLRAVKHTNEDYDQLLLVGMTEVLVVENDTLKQEVSTDLNPLPYAFHDEDKGYFLCADNGGGLLNIRLTPESGSIEFDTLLQEHSIAYGLFDRQGGLWVASRDAGLFYAPHPKVAHFAKEQGLPSSKSLSLALSGDSVFFAGYSDGSIFLHNYKSGGSRPLFSNNAKQSYEAYSLYFDQQTNHLYSNQHKFLYKGGYPNPRITAERYSKTGSRLFKSIREFHQLSLHNPRELLFSGNGVLGIFDLDQNTVNITYQGKPGEHSVFNAYFEDQNRKTWVGTLHGLYELDEENGVLDNRTFGHDALKRRVEEIVQLSNGGLVFGTRGSGLIYYSKDTTYAVDQSHGLAANNIRNLHLTRDEVLWVATLQGISKLTFTEKGPVKSIRSFGTSHGLTTDEVYDIQSRGQDIWLASGNGVVQFREPAVIKDSPLPTIQTLYINGEACNSCLQEELSLKHQEKNLTLEFKTINYRMLGQIQYRYKHQASAPWQYTRQNQVNYIDLNPGQYTFEVQSQNQDGKWSKSSKLQFKIQTPWFRHWLFQATSVLLLFGLVTFFFRQRDRRRIKEQNYLRKIDNLEKAALHAQMNPHFIFNSLTSIQNFILRNEKKNAVTYLAKFAQLIRMTLNVSIKGIHSLEEELEAIKNYLNLEQIRYGQDFSYRIDVAAHLQPAKILLPPLLIQPFIENAIKHGLKDRKTGGKVEVYFSGTAQLLEVRIIDNGIGFDLAAGESPNSAGMDITRRRLELMQHQDDSTPVLKIELLQNSKDEVVGTMIIIFIHTQQKGLT